MSWWPFPIIRNNASDHELSTIFQAFARAEDLEIVCEAQYEIALACRLGRLQFWNANAYFAWANEGRFTSASGHLKSWQRKMPSRSAVRELRKALVVARILRGTPDSRPQAERSPEPVAASTPPRGIEAPALSPADTGRRAIAADISMRDLLAGLAMTGILASVRDKVDLSEIKPADFYAWADELLSAQSSGFTPVPLVPNEALLRPFYECPPQELNQAYSAMLMVAKAQRAQSNGAGPKSGVYAPA